MSIGRDRGVDEQTLEARTYGPGRFFRPFMVNNVSGFIGPETIYDGKEMIQANLEDHFMGKFLGLPMGMAPCWTNHTSITMDDQQQAAMLLALAGASALLHGCPAGRRCHARLPGHQLPRRCHAARTAGTYRGSRVPPLDGLAGLCDDGGVLTERAGDGSIFF